jgi:hypothetical protein
MRVGGDAAFPRAIGRDRLYRAGERLILVSRVDMRLLHPRKYRRTTVTVDDRPYFVARREGGDGRDYRYVLEPWPTTVTDLPGAIVTYDAEFVTMRDSEMRSQSRLVLAHRFLLPLMPVAGFMPSRLKLLLEDKLGIPARRSTFLSILLELAVFFALGVLSWVVTYASLQAGALGGMPELVGPAKLYTAVSLLLVDTWFRYGSYVRGDRIPYGVGEWLLGRPPAGEREP